MALTDWSLDFMSEALDNVQETIIEIKEEIKRIWVAIRKKADWATKYPCPELTAVDGTFTWAGAHTIPITNIDDASKVYHKIEIRREADHALIHTVAKLEDDTQAFTVQFDAFGLGKITTIPAGTYAAYII